MHELSIVESIINIATEVVKEHQAASVDSIELEIGDLAGIEMSALDFAWNAAVNDTVLHHAERKINRMNGLALCLVCANKFPVVQYYDACPLCGSYKKEILEGNELKVKRITLSKN